MRIPVPKFLKEWWRSYLYNKYAIRLKYTHDRLKDPHHDDMEEDVRKYRIEIVGWLLLFYSGSVEAAGEGTPEQRLFKLLRKPPKYFNARDQVYSHVLHSWTTYKRIEGF